MGISTEWAKNLMILVVLAIAGLSLIGCTQMIAPQEFAPDGKVVEQAIAAQLDRYYAQLGQQLSGIPPRIELQQIQVQTIEPLVVGKLPTYHLQGTYDLTLKFVHQTVQKKRNTFELYLQRQREGKTWRSLEKIGSQWRSRSLN